MLYVRHYKKDGLIAFVPIRDTNVYVECSTCGKIVPISEPCSYIAEFGYAVARFGRDFDECEERTEIRYKEEDGYCEALKASKE